MFLLLVISIYRTLKITYSQDQAAIPKLQSKLRAAEKAAAQNCSIHNSLLADDSRNKDKAEQSIASVVTAASASAPVHTPVETTSNNNASSPATTVNIRDFASLNLKIRQQTPEGNIPDEFEFTRDTVLPNSKMKELLMVTDKTLGECKDYGKIGSSKSSYKVGEVVERLKQHLPSCTPEHLLIFKRLQYYEWVKSQPSIITDKATSLALRFTYF
jgi:hypothetical protein